MSESKAEFDAETLQIAELRLQGVSATAIARELGVTRQAIDMRIKNYLGVHAYRSIAEQAREKARKLRTEKSKSERDKALHTVIPPRNSKKRFSDEEMLEALRRFERRHGQPVSATRLSNIPIAEREGCPSPAIYYRRFGSWTRALELAGVTNPAPRSRRSYSKLWTFEDIENVLVEYASYAISEDRRPTQGGYVEWRAEQGTRTLPSIATITNTCSTWANVMTRVLRRV